jgi:hypothetical protein
MYNNKTHNTTLKVRMEYADMYHHDLNASNEMDSITLNSLAKFSTKNYHRLWRSGIQIGVYASGDSSYIRNAETGEVTNYAVGSANEDLFFKVRVTGEIPSGAVTLFYSSPEHYEKHQHTVLTDDMKYVWKEKQWKFMSKMFHKSHKRN